MLLTPDFQVARESQKEKVTTAAGPFGVPVITGKKSIGKVTIPGPGVQVVF